MGQSVIFTSIRKWKKTLSAYTRFRLHFDKLKKKKIAYLGQIVTLQAQYPALGQPVRSFQYAYRTDPIVVEMDVQKFRIITVGEQFVQCGYLRSPTTTILLQSL